MSLNVIDALPRGEPRAAPEFVKPELLRTLRTVLGAALLAVLDALGIENTTDDVATHARQVLYAAAADHDHGVFLKVMTFARNVADDFEAVGEADQ